MRQRRMAEVFGAQLGEAELFLPGDFPQEVELDVAGHLVRGVQHLGCARRGELQQHVPRADLGALARRQLDLVSLALLR
jgi:hypothetical protein